MRTSKLLFITVLLTSTPFVSQAAEKKIDEKTDYSKITLDVTNFNPASQCGKCHVDIYAFWKESIHSKALTEPAFQATFGESQIQNDDAVKSRCLQCHAPAFHYNPDLSLTSGVATEGVTCDFCHSIQDIDLKNTDKPFVVAWGKLKRGPFRDSKSPVHETRRSNIFESGDLCGGCHQMQNMKGLPIITTYSEWKDNYYKKIADTNCQDCHMPLAAGTTVSSKYRKLRRRINLHAFPGGHSRAQLLDALNISVVEATRTQGRMKVRLALENVGAGHSIPTGNPLRKVVVDFSAYDATNKLIHSEQTELSRKFADKNGNRLSTDLDILLNATSLLDDNRIPPGGTRQFTYEFAAPNEKILLDVRVIYLYSNEAFPNLTRQEKLITFTRVVNKQSAQRAPEEVKEEVKSLGEESSPKGEPVNYSKISLDFKTANSASVCGKCHIDIYGLWKQSMHSKALTDPAFRSTFMEGRIQKDEDAKNRCLQCHAPTYHYDPKLSLTSGVATEGITCDFCHSVQALSLKNEARPFSVSWGKLKRGPFKDATSPVHDTKNSEIFEKGDFCGGCHEMQNMKGLPIITTYTEWKDHYYNKISQSNCQDCHMPLAEGITVSPEYKRTQRRINLHSFPGGHSRAQLLDALEIKILEATRTYGKMKIKLGLSNVGAGHYIPTGNPLRKVIVDFSAYSATNKLIHNKKVELSKRFVDEQGKDLATDLDILLDAVRVSQDNRIPPGATKELNFEFMAPDEKLLVDTKVTYVYDNKKFPKLARQEKLITFTVIVNRQPTRRVVEGSKVPIDDPWKKDLK